MIGVGLVKKTEKQLSEWFRNGIPERDWNFDAVKDRLNMPESIEPTPRKTHRWVPFRCVVTLVGGLLAGMLTVCVLNNGPGTPCSHIPDTTTLPPSTTTTSLRSSPVTEAVTATTITATTMTTDNGNRPLCDDNKLTLEEMRQLSGLPMKSADHLPGFVCYRFVGPKENPSAYVYCLEYAIIYFYSEIPLLNPDDEYTEVQYGGRIYCVEERMGYVKLYSILGENKTVFASFAEHTVEECLAIVDGLIY